MIAEFSVYPLNTEHMSKDVAKVVRVLEATGLEYRLGPVGTSVEGDLGQVLTAIQRCHEAVAKDHDRVITTITLDDRKNRPHHLGELAACVQEHLKSRVPTADMDSQC